MPAELSSDLVERYARLRAALIPARAAVKAMGRDPKTGVVTRWERNKRVQARIAELVGENEGATQEVIREKRRQIEVALSAIAYGDGTDFVHKGKMPELDWQHRLGALSQLRDMWGHKAPTKIAQTDRTGERDVFDRMTDEELREAVAKEVAALGLVTSPDQAEAQAEPSA